jgi:uncharacterized membrane protein YidH (DUF202 family)
MKELLQGRRFGYAPRPAFGMVAAGVGIGATLLDLMAWFQWGARDTNGFVVGAFALGLATAIVGAIATLAAVAEWVDVPDEERSLARLDFIAALVATLLYAVSSIIRSGEIGAAGASPAPLLISIAGLAVLLVDGVIAANLYSAREWEVIEDEDERPERQRRRRIPAR